MKKYKLFLFTTLFFIPTLVFANSGNNSSTIVGAIMMEAFVSIHMSIFVLKPLSMMFSKENNKKLFWQLFIIRTIILLFFDFFITPAIALYDFIAVFIGAFLVVPICALITKIPINHRNNQVIQHNKIIVPTNSPTNDEIILKCTKCSGILKITDKFCSNCGEPFDGNNVTVSTQQKILVNPSNFDPIYSNNEEKLLEAFIDKELVKAGINKDNSLIPVDILKKKYILNTIFSVLIFIYISLIFFHFPPYTYVIGLIILLILYKATKNYNLIKYLKREIKSRPCEKISNIIMNVKSSFVTDNGKLIRLSCIIVAFILPLIIFINPRIMYEKIDNGYAVRFYTFGLTNFTKATIPQTYNKKPVISLRGNTFSNMPFLEKVTLPNTITKIRGQAFKNDRNLISVNIPNNLEYLGGGAFYNCTSITNIELPDTLTYMGGEAFYNATALKNVKLSENLIEIRGNTFEKCSSLQSIKVPDNVTRIGGHAFYGNTSLSEVVLTENSALNEIGSSAFRMCTELYSITLPEKVSINERAFKESPTNIRYFRDNQDYYDSDLSSNQQLYILYLNQNNYINDKLIITLTSFTDTTHDENIFIGMSGTIKIMTKKETYYFNFQTSSPSVYKYNFEDYTLEVKSGMDDHIKIELN